MDSYTTTVFSSEEQKGSSVGSRPVQHVVLYFPMHSILLYTYGMQDKVV